MKNIILWLVVSYFCTYWGLFWLVGYEGTAYIIAALLFGLASMVLFTWWTTGVQAVKDGREGAAILAFSICVIALYGVTTRLTSVYRITMENPEWMNSSGLVLGQAVLLLLFFTGVLLAPETKGGNVPKKNLIWWALSLLAAGCFIGVIIGISLSKEIPTIPKAESMSAPMSLPAVPVCGTAKPVPVRAYCRARPNLVQANAG